MPLSTKHSPCAFSVSSIFFIAVITVLLQVAFMDLRVAVSGGVDSGKSSLVAVLSHGSNGAPALDNGRGSARMSVLKHKHELESGRTSSISQQVSVGLWGVSRGAAEESFRHRGKGVKHKHELESGRTSSISQQVRVSYHSCYLSCLCHSPSSLPPLALPSRAGAGIRPRGRGAELRRRLQPDPHRDQPGC